MAMGVVFVNRPVMAIAINLVLLIVGLIAYERLELRHSPNITQNEVNITTHYPGANSLAVEHQVTKPLEDALAGLEGIKKISSVTQDGQSQITVKLKPDVNNVASLNQIRDRVLSAMGSLPESVQRPEISEEAENGRAILYLIFEDKTKTTAALSDYIRRFVEDRLRLVEGIAEVNNFGNKLYTISILPDSAKLLEQGVSILDVVNALKREKTFLSGGEIEGAIGKQSVVLTTGLETPKDFENVTVMQTPRGRVSIKDVARVGVTEKSTYLNLRLDGQETVGLSIKAKPRSNPLLVAERVRHFVSDLEKKLPSTLKVNVSYDATKPFKASFISLQHTLWEAILLVGVVVTISLASVRAALIPIITIPLCLIGSFALMWLLGFSLNPITLLALVLAVGLVVDDAIVVVENIHQHMEQGLTALQAARKSMKEISFAVVVMTVTLSAVYLPIAFQPDESAVMFREFAWTLAGSVIISGFVALTLTPALCGKFLRQSTGILPWERGTHYYKERLTSALKHPKKIATILGGAAILGIIGFTGLRSELVPTEDEDYIEGYVSAENAVLPLVREGWLKEIEATLSKVPEREHILTGVWLDNWPFWQMSLKPRAERNRSAQEMIASIQPDLKNIVGPLVGVQSLENNLNPEDLFKIVIQYPGEREELVVILNTLLKEAQKIPGFERVMSEQTWEKARLKMHINRALATELGVSLESVENTLYTFLSGRKVARYNFKGLDYDVEVRGEQPIRSERDAMNTFFVAGDEGQWIPLGSLVTLEEVLEPTQIKHFDRMRSGTISVILKPEMSVDKAIALLEPLVKKHLPTDAQYYFGGKAEKYREANKAMWVTFGLSLVFIYLVLAALFESFIHPFIVLLTVPLSVSGAVLAVRWMGGTNNVYTGIGLVTLVGLITKHGILIVDFANRLRTAGKPIKEAILLAASARLRPVLMTTFAMIFGAIPLTFTLGSGAVARQHIGWVIIGGMLTGTMLSLFVIPVMYHLIERYRSKRSSIFPKGGALRTF